jgi:hypothetical protein
LITSIGDVANPTYAGVGLVGYSSAVQVVEASWDSVWSARAPEKVDEFVVDDFVLTTGGERVEGRENFKACIKDRCGDSGLIWGMP